MFLAFTFIAIPLCASTTFVHGCYGFCECTVQFYGNNQMDPMAGPESPQHAAEKAGGDEQRFQDNSERSAAFLAALRMADQAHARFDNLAALAAYQEAMRIDSVAYEVLWKLARSHIDVGFAAKDPHQRNHYFQAEHFARSCVALYPDSAQGHFFLAVALGRVALKVGGKKKVQLSKEIKAEAERALAINPRHDGAMHVLGRWNYELANLSWVLRAFAKVLYGGVPPGGNEQARDWFEKALATNPVSPAHHLWLGETLIQLKNYPQAAEHLQTCQRLRDLMWDDALNKKQAEKTLKRIQGKLE